MLAVSKKYLQDKLVLLLVSVNIFLAFLSAALIFLHLNVGGGNDGYIVEYRSNLGISAFKTGSLTTIFSFAVFSFVVVGLAVALSLRTYNIRRDLALTVLGASGLLVVLTIIVSNSLMVLH
ncbi:MAG TPA: hypothetical protein VLF91_01085 [Candidatus Saccharimonadales bacterium]|nr:hypothetical protein [Candidatus Saccharimonadales bacterium]